MIPVQDDNKVYVFPYGRYIGKDNQTNKTYVQISGEEYVEVEPKWDGILKTSTTVPTLTQFKEVLTKAGVPNADEYIDSLIAGEMITLVDSGDNVKSSIGNLYEWALVPTCKYEGQSTLPAVNNIPQVNISTVENSLPFTISELTLKVIADQNQRILGTLLPIIVTEYANGYQVEDSKLYSMFANDVRKLIQHKAAFFS